MSDYGKCTVRVSDHTGFHFSECGRPAKGEHGRCGIHQRSHEAKVARERRWREASSDRDVQRERIAVLPDAARARLWFSDNEVGTVSVDIDWLLLLWEARQ